MSARALGIAVVAALAFTAVAVAADSTDPKLAPTKAGQAYASSSTLRAGDLGPAWSGGAVKPSSLKLPVCPSNQPNDGDLTITGHAESRLTRASGPIQVDADVLVFENAGQVAKLVRRIILDPSIGDCLRYDLIKSVGGQGVTIVGVSALPVARAGDHSALFRLTLSVKSGAKAFPVYNDYLYVSQGRAQYFVSIVAPGAAKSELAPLENGIAKKLAARARP